jgi:hypothetical protein
MKKIYLFLSISILILQSCSSTDGDLTSSSTVLVKKSIYTDPSGDYITTINSYNGNKAFEQKTYINDILYGTTRITYNGDLITKAESYDTNNILIEKDVYNYDNNNKLASYIELDYRFNHFRRNVYDNSLFGLVTYNCYEGDENYQNNLISTGEITFQNGEISKHVEHTGATTKTSTFTYDNQNSPSKNVLGHDKVTYAVIGTFTSQINHNLIQLKISYSGNSNGFIKDYQYTFNNDGYPITRYVTSNGNFSESSQIFY